MVLLVQKFGGTSVGDLERIERAARKVAAETARGHRVAVVVSAMGGETDRLIGLTRQANPIHDAREYDVVVSAGEQVTAGLMALTLQRLGVAARSWLGWQVPVRTDDSHGRARIETIDTATLRARLDSGQVAVVAGFQGMGSDNRTTTLGRGGSDTSAVALAAALGADRCDIYTDVAGVCTADPRIVPGARRLARVTYEEMLEMASLGARVLQTRSVEIAMKHRVPVQVLSSFADGTGSDLSGTLIVADTQAPEPGGAGPALRSRQAMMEQELVSSVTHSRDEAKLTLVGVADKPGVSAATFGPLAAANVNVDMIVQNIGTESGHTDLTFTVNRADLDRARRILEGLRDELDYEKIVCDANVVKISVIGVGMRSHAGVAQTMFRAMAEKGINIQVISTSEIKISILVAGEFTELALRALHTAYGLDRAAQGATLP